MEYIDNSNICNNNKILLKFESLFKDEDLKKSHIRIIYENGDEVKIKLNETKLIEIEECKKDDTMYQSSKSLFLIGKLNLQLWSNKYWGKNCTFGFISNNNGVNKSVIKTIDSPIIIDCFQTGNNEFTIQLLNKRINLNKNENKLSISLFSKSPLYISNNIVDYQLKLILNNGIGGRNYKSILIDNENTNQIYLPVLKSKIQIKDKEKDQKNYHDFYSTYKAIYDIELIQKANGNILTTGSITLEINNELSSSHNKFYNIIQYSFKPFNGTLELIDETKKQQLIFNFNHSIVGNAKQ